MPIKLRHETRVVMNPWIEDRADYAKIREQAVADVVRAESTIKMSYFVPVVDGYVIAEGLGRAARRTFVPEAMVERGSIQHTMEEFGIMLPIDPLTALSWGWIDLKHMLLPEAFKAIMVLAEHARVHPPKS
jgi:hypothetical protein